MLTSRDLKLLNLGCGTTLHPAWVNLDRQAGPGVQPWEARAGIPFPDGTFDGVYHSHLLEHLDREDAALLSRDCLRVLRPGGVLRVAVPDLERIVRGYLAQLERALEGDDANYEWMAIELLDQLVRTRSGGSMRDYLTQPNVPNLGFVKERVGGEIDRIAASANPPLHKRLLLRGMGKLLGKQRVEALRQARFRERGELHRWMYDRFSLPRLLEQAGFHQARAVGANESGLPNWTDYALDTDSNGGVRKPDSLFVEARRP